VTGSNVDQPDQGAALAFLDAKVRSGAAKRIDTHASIVFLEPDRALKIKRAVRLPFLDYSTLEKRKHACEEELAVNRRFAPKLYRRVVPITLGAKGPEIAGNGSVIEWAVEMARFDEGKTLDHLARAKELKPELAEMLADIICDSHEGAEISNGFAWLSSIATFIDRNTAKFRGQASLTREAVERLHDWSHRQFDAMLPLLRERAAKGFVRRCHGDAHLGNIVLIDGKPVLFDAIEFDPVIATTDILYDLAFPIMDLVQFGLRAAANRLFNHYLQSSWQENADALRLLPLFLSMRAAIRSHVLFTKCEQSPNDNDAADAKSYFDLALAFLESGQPSLIAIGGKSGTGKSVLAREVAPLLPPSPGAIVLCSDVIRKELFRVDPLVALPETAYAPQITADVYRELLDRARKVTAQGFSVIVDAAFLQQAERDELSAEAPKMKADFRAVFLTTDLAIRLERVGSRRHDASDATPRVANDQEGYVIGRIDWPIVDASDSPAQTLRRSLIHLGAG
jgi:aminoglycoside phosphotransferase family enzyme/predicted kinase